MGDNRQSSDEWEPEERHRKEFKARNNGRIVKLKSSPRGELKRSCKLKSLRFINNSETSLGSHKLVACEKGIPDGLPLELTQKVKGTKKGGKASGDVYNVNPTTRCVSRSITEEPRCLDSDRAGKLTNEENLNDVDEDKTSGGSGPLFPSCCPRKLSNKGPTSIIGKKMESYQVRSSHRGSKRLVPELSAAKTHGYRVNEESSNENAGSVVDDSSSSCQNVGMQGVTCTFGSAKSVKFPAECSNVKDHYMPTESDKCSHSNSAATKQRWGKNDEKYSWAGRPDTSEHSEGVESSTTSLYHALDSSINLPLEELWQDPCIAFAIQTLTGSTLENEESISLPNGFGLELTNVQSMPFPEYENAVSETLPTAEETAIGQSAPGDAWSDPCIEFAIKTLTDAIPLDYSMAIQNGGCQVLSTSHSQSSARSGEINHQYGVSNRVGPHTGLTDPCASNTCGVSLRGSHHLSEERSKNM